ncbi:MAG: diaminopimelate epimerase [Alphaproteobacteria bacterium]|nr:diaminopimelate epimerase [Alphaproteobacteria bacterium]
MKKIPFIKMDGLGNDFVILRDIDLTEDEIRAIGNRKTGVGFDQLIVLKPSKIAEIKILFFNADGSVAGACGNGSRCTAKLLMDEMNKDSIIMESPTGGLLKGKRAEGDLISVNMGQPKLAWNEIPIKEDQDTLNIKGISDELPLPVGVSMGNPHAVFFVDDINKINDEFLSKWGNYVEHHEMFPQRVNVEFAQVVKPDLIRMRVWERGAGITEACGTGACATLTAAVRRKLSNNKAKIQMDGGSLIIEWDKNHDIIMTGTTHTSFKGELYL